MRSLKPFIMTFVILNLVFSGCAAGKQVRGPLHDEVLRQPLAFDLTYLRTLEALENVDNWELEETEKEKGIIHVRNVNYTTFDDADLRSAVVLVKRVSRKETTVELAPESQRILGVEKLLERIGQFLNKEIQST